MIAGVASYVFMVLSTRDAFSGLNAGFIALCANFAVAFMVSILASQVSSRRAADLTSV
jgi:hypothetical protein